MTGSAFKRWTLYGRSGGVKEQREGVWGRERARDSRGPRAGGFFLAVLDARVCVGGPAFWSFFGSKILTKSNMALRWL